MRDIRGDEVAIAVKFCLMIEESQKQMNTTLDQAWNLIFIVQNFFANKDQCNESLFQKNTFLLVSIAFIRFTFRK